MSALIVPKDVEEALQSLRPELRRKLSFRDIDDIRKPYINRITVLEMEVEKLRTFIKDLQQLSEESSSLSSAAIVRWCKDTLEGEK